MQFQEDPLRPEHDLDVVVPQGVFENGNGDGAELEKLSFGGLARLGCVVAQLRDQRTGAVLKPRVDPMNHDDSGADHFLGGREDVEEGRLVTIASRV